MIELVFWICCGLLLYVYVLYPILMRVLAMRFGRPAVRGDALPTVTIIVTAYNEEKCITSKLDNLCKLRYPSHLVDILVVSDSSTDLTERLAATYDPERVHVLRVEGRRGKTACQNAAAAAASGEILVFTDATTQVSVDALHRLVECFVDPEIGCVGGRLTYVSELNNCTGRGGEIYWSYELSLRAAESRLGSMIGVSGCLYAVRKRAYREINPSLISDFVIAMRMREQGLRTVLAPDATCFEATLERGSHELAMRVRVAMRSLDALIRERRFLNPLRYGCFAWQLWSHKVVRYASPVLWLGALSTNVALATSNDVALALEGPFYLALLAGQCAVLAAGLLGFVLQSRRRELGLLGQPYYFLLTNVASLIATLRYLQGERMVTWQPIR